jgi:signal transduction histidine kinase
MSWNIWTRPFSSYIFLWMALVLLFVTSLTIGGAFASRERDKMVLHTLEVLQELETFEASILAAEIKASALDAAARLEDRGSAKRHLDQAKASIARMVNLTSDNTRQQVRLTMLRNLTNQAASAFEVQLRQEAVVGPNVVPYSTNFRPQLPIAETVGEIRREEQQLLRQRQNARATADGWFGVLSSTGLAFNLLMIWWTYAASRRYVQQRNEREYEIRALNFRLAEQVEEIRDLNSTLEQRVSEKTVELAATVEKLQRSNAELERFVYIAAHDLQEPLRQIASFNNLLASRYKDSLDEKGHQYLAYSIAGARRLQLMLQGLLEFSLVTPAAFNPVATPLEPLIQGALADLKAQIAATNASIVVSGASDFDVVVDREMIRTVFRSLISNALKFQVRDVDPRIAINVRQDNGDWIATVSDNGQGIESHFEQKIFVLFARLHSVGEYEGAGVGLAISKRIVEAHGGTLAVTANPEGQGSVFRIQIPMQVSSGTEGQTVPS